MGKKNKKKSKDFQLPITISGSAADGSMIIEYSPVDEDGFKILEPTPVGRISLAPFQKKSANATMVSASAFSAGTTRMNLNLAMERIKKGKFGKAHDTMKEVDIEGLANAFVNISQDDDQKQICGEVRDLLSIGKSFYEYDPKQRQVIPDSIYDQIIAHWRAFGMEEPVGIVPSDSKKTSIKYETLHNNMDKAYILHKDDEIPAGVKETDSVEEFFLRAYKELGLSKKDKIRIAVSPKIDGVSVNGTVSGNLLVDPQTRGDESASMKVIGLDQMQITDIDPDSSFGIQFECFLTHQDMEAAAAYFGKEEYANNRNAVAGLISRLCTAENPDLLPFLSFYPIEAEGLDMRYMDRMKYLENFRIVPTDMIDTEYVIGDVKELLNEIGTIFSQYNEKRGDLSYVIDGMVITIADDENQEILGRKGRRNQYQIALKFDPENAVAVVDHIDLDMGKKGYRTPQVYLSNPVILGGARYDHIPMLSADLFEQLDLREGSVVNVHRVGDVIPSITVIDEGSGEKLHLTKNCPACGEEMIIKNKKLFCKNPACANNQVGRMLSLFEGIKLDGYSDAFVKDLIENSHGNITSPGDLVDLDEEYLTRIGMTGKTEQKFPERFRTVMSDTYDYVILGSFGIPDLGKSRARKLLAYHGSLPNMLYAFDGGGVEALALRSTLGKVGGNIEEYFNEFPDAAKGIFSELQRLYDEGFIQKLTSDFENTIRIGHTGGDLSEEVEAICEERGYEIVDGSSFDILITASYNSTSGKMKKAQKKELPIYTQEEFIEEYGSYEVG